MKNQSDYFSSSEFRSYYPFQSKFEEVGSHRLHYVDEGQGDPVVMVHGNPSWSFYYRNLIQSLQGQYRVVAPDHIGCGLSDKPSEKDYDYTLEQRVSDLEELLNRLNLGSQITLVLHDWGGMIGMAYADRHPDKIKRIILLNTGAFPLPKTKPFPWQLALGRNTQVGKYLILGLNAFAQGAARIGCKRQPMSASLRKAYCAPYNSFKNRVATLKFVQDIPLSDQDRAFEIVSSVQSRIRQFESTPTLICWGDLDFVFDRHFLTEWKKYLPQSEVHQFSDCGHYILEDASDEVIPIVKNFLEAHPL